MKSNSTVSQGTVYIINWDVFHSKGACQKIVSIISDDFRAWEAYMHYKRQLSSFLCHPTLLPSLRNQVSVKLLLVPLILPRKFTQ